MSSIKNRPGQTKNTLEKLGVRTFRFLDITPIALPLSLALAGALLILLLLPGWFYPPLVLISILLSISFSYWFVANHIAATLITPARLMILAGLYGLVVSWVGINAYYSSQHIHTNRDPATYGVSALRLSDTPNLKIEKEGAIAHPKVVEHSAGFQQDLNDKDALGAQGAHLLPALLAPFGYLGGDSLVLKANPVIGGVALLAVFGFAQLIMRARWALLVTLVTSSILPMIYFTRDTYTEPLAMVFVFGGLSMLFIAERSKKLLPWLLLGIIAGAGALTRIDAILTSAGLTAGAALAALLAGGIQQKQLSRRFMQYSSFVAALAFTLSIGWLDVSYLSSTYYQSQEDKIVPLYLLVAAIVAAGYLMIGLLQVDRVRSLMRSLLKKAVLVRLGLAAFVGTIALFVVLASRPLWYVGYRESSIGLTQSLQAAAGLTVDGFRDFSEDTITWMSWYIGPLLVVFAVLGFALIARKAVMSKSAIWFAFTAVIMVTALLYFVKPSITPDQIWASRRFLPVVMPGMIIAGFFALGWIWEKYKTQRFLSSMIHVSVVIPVLATLIVAYPLATAAPFIKQRTYVPQLGQTRDICSQLDPTNTVVVWVGAAGWNQIEPTRAVCGAATYRLVSGELGSEDPSSTSSKILQEVASSVSDGRRLVIGSYANTWDKQEKPAALINERTVSLINFCDYEQTIISPPSGIQCNEREIRFYDVAGMDVR